MRDVITQLMYEQDVEDARLAERFGVQMFQAPYLKGTGRLFIRSTPPSAPNIYMPPLKRADVVIDEVAHYES